MFNLSCTYPCAVWRSVVAFRHFAMVQSAAMLTVHLACHQVRTIALVLPLLHVSTANRQHSIGLLPDFLAYNRRNNALILKHHPLRFRFEDHFLGKHVLRSNFIPSSPHVGLWVGTTQCRSASDSLQKGAELFFPAPNRLFFFHLLFISPMNMLFRGVAPPLHNLEN